MAANQQNFDSSGEMTFLVSAGQNVYINLQGTAAGAAA